MVIFGAGASSDSSPAYPLSEYTDPDLPINHRRPPLADQLFHMRFAEVFDHFPRATPVIAHLLPRTGKQVDVENVLEGLLDRARVGELEEYSELVAVQFYLQAMLWQCRFQWLEAIKNVTNYAALMNTIRDLKEPSCLVTFNYDTLLEDALSLPTFGLQFRRLSDYVRTGYKVIKVHGSISWAHEIKSPVGIVRGDNQLQAATKIINQASKGIVVNGSSYEIVYPSREDFENGFPIGKWGEGQTPMIPALAVPVVNKPEDQLPPEHRVVLEECLPQITKVLVVGWRANESGFLGKLAGALSRSASRVSFMIVSGSEEGAANAWNRIRERLGVIGVRLATGAIIEDVRLSKKGFTDAVRDRDIEAFLKNQ